MGPSSTVVKSIERAQRIPWSSDSTGCVSQKGWLTFSPLWLEAAEGKQAFSEFSEEGILSPHAHDRLNACL